MITIFKPTAAPISAPIYAAFEGVFLGAISQAIQIRYQDKFPGAGGIVMQAVSLTAGVLCVMMFVYATRLIRVTDKLRLAIVSATCAVALFYLASMVLRLFGFGTPGDFCVEPDARYRLQPFCRRPGGV